MEIKQMLGRMIPFVIGLLIGAGFTKNKYVYVILISYVIMIFLFSLLSSKITKVKKSTDKKLAMRNAAVESINEAIDTTEKGHLYGNSLFDKYYPGYIFYINVILLLGSIYSLINKQYLWSFLMFLTMNLFVILNQVWRKVKYLGTEGYDKFVKEQKFTERAKKLEKKQLAKMGLVKDGN